MQWPCARPNTENLPGTYSNSSRSLLRISEAVESIIPEWLRLYQNWELSEYIGLVQQALSKYRGQKHEAYYTLPKYKHVNEFSRQFGTGRPILLSHLVEKAGPIYASNDLNMALKSEPVARNLQKKSTQIADSSEI